MDDTVFQAALAGLLHDIGKFAQRGGWPGKHAEIGVRVIEQDFKNLCPDNWATDVIDAIANHHGGDTHKEITKAVRVADWLASAERDKGHAEKGDSKATPLIPITAKVELDKEHEDVTWTFPLRALSLKPEGVRSEGLPEYPPLFPRQNVTSSPQGYLRLWQAFNQAIQVLPAPINTFSHFAGLMSMVRQYTTQIPAATPWEDEEADRTVPDVSLYDHMKVTAAIAACLCKLSGEHPNHLDELHQLKPYRVFDDTRPVAQLLQADFSGIQSFIYRITEPARERENRAAAKRLRGRSFYLSLLNEVVADWFLRELGLTSANALFIGGGRFDLLLPVDPITTAKVEQLKQKLNNWLIKEFYGTVGLVLACEQLAPSDFKSLKRAIIKLDGQLAQAKQQKFSQSLLPEFFEAEPFLEANGKIRRRVCNVCGLTPTETDEACRLCELHKRIGQWLPKTAYIARIYGLGPLEDFKDKTIDFADPINMKVMLLQNSAEVSQLLKAVEQANLEATLYSLNDNPVPILNWPAKTAPAQLYLANAAPKSIYEDVLEFEDIAELSSGTKLLGILRADVDHLGLIFSLGLDSLRTFSGEYKDLLTISRVASLSHIFDRFFGGYLNTLCRNVTGEWRQSLSDEDKTALREKKSLDADRLDSLFYTVYAGGDDLLIIGPWDQTIKLAQQLYTDFRAYTCHNPNITLSAGITLVKPHFPVQRFVELAKEALEEAKNKGRDRIKVFEEEPVRWTDYGSPTALDELLKLAHKLLKQVEVKQMPRTFIHDMEQMRRIEIKTLDGSFKPMITPQLFYLLTRRLPKEVRDELKKPILDAWIGIRIPLSYVSLSTREE